MRLIPGFVGAGHIYYGCKSVEGSRCIDFLNKYNSICFTSLLVFTGSGHRSLMPFQISELVEMSLLLRNACMGMIELAHPETRPMVADSYFGAMLGSDHDDNGTSGGTTRATDQNAEIAKWTHLFKVSFCQNVMRSSKISLNSK